MEERGGVAAKVSGSIPLNSTHVDDNVHRQCSLTIEKRKSYMRASSCPPSQDEDEQKYSTKTFSKPKALCNMLHRSTFHISLLMHRLADPKDSFGKGGILRCVFNKRFFG